MPVSPRIPPETRRQIRLAAAQALLHWRRRELVGMDGWGDSIIKTYHCYSDDGRVAEVKFSGGEVLEINVEHPRPPIQYSSFGQPVSFPAPRPKPDTSRWPAISVSLTGDIEDGHGTVHASYFSKHPRRHLYTRHIPVTWDYDIEGCPCCGSWATVSNIQIDGGIQESPLQIAVEHLLDKLGDEAANVP